MKFIFADCLDYVDPNYDFINDRSAADRQPYWHDKFPHEMLEDTPYDGMLVSRAIVEDKYTDSQSMRFRRVGAREFLRFNRPQDKGKWVFGDCGAFQYAKLETPPYSPTNMAEFYSDGRFTHGCSVDHIIFDFYPDLKDDSPPQNAEAEKYCRYRYDLTLANAEAFLAESKHIDNFTPLGVVQGWSPGSMATAASELLKMGYKYLAIGGLVPLKAEDIQKTLDIIFDKISYQPNASIHLLGFEKANLLDGFIGRYPITSIDTTSPLTKAFKDDKKNFYLDNGCGGITYYTAIRIPQAMENLSFKRAVQSGLLKQETITEVETRALNSLRQYDKKQVSLDTALEDIMEYTRLFFSAKNAVKKTSAETIKKNLNNLAEEYHRTLLERPWKQCDCAICKKASVEVIIFRASNRNKRRGIHNIKVFYDHLREKRGF
ncbi:hypothetical protein M1B72_02685 [Geomonas paludis]|uniref:tRNA-guanine(15) transglycosylase-like domain-containing protein n=1 Tax=Geomonas paludis TaxID=2740185 RepID=A0A6V8N2K5_9BACT|nr:tRNA-guanine transglycosylase DpdA [Geomonas paludis]UPU36630.1 hypothetical protein M1B72_02685 [Geomonas paludis]GFO65893.1 hypothetical protein GMPD_38120 [Geomonas paludis]